MAASSPEHLKQVPLASVHQEWGARMVEFGGWLMPVQYSGILAEHHAVRQAAGLFDISHMGEIFVSGPGAKDWLNGVLTNDVSKLEQGHGHYTFLLNERGGVIDDLIIYCLAPAEYLLIVNASHIEEDETWLLSLLPASGVQLENRSEAMSGLALQGPRSLKIFAVFFGAKAVAPLRNQIAKFAVDGLEIFAARTGYTGEDGFEFFFVNSGARSVWEGILKAGESLGIKPCGLGARDTLRLESCYPLNGNDLSPDRTPLQAGLGFFVSLDKPSDFPGKSVLLEQKKNGLPDRLMPFRVIGKSAPPRAHYVIYADGRKIGESTSGVLSPTLNMGIGLAYVETALAKPGQPVEVEIRGTRYPAELAKKPLYIRPAA